MSKKYLVAPSVLSADFSRLGEEVKAVFEGGADRIHVDVMDGHFVPNLTIGVPVVRSLKAVTTLPLDIHLMVHKPENFILPFAQAGASSLIIHIESTDNPIMVLQKIKQKNISAGLALKPSTPIEHIFTFLDHVSLVLIMTVEPGFSGQTLLPDQISKIKNLRGEITRRRLSQQVLIHVDGGVNDKVLPHLTDADILVSGDFIFKQKDYKQAINILKNTGHEQ